MKHLVSSQNYRRSALPVATAVLLGFTAFSANAANPNGFVPANVGQGLETILQARVAERAAANSRPVGKTEKGVAAIRTANPKLAALQTAASEAKSLAILHPDGRVHVQVTLNGEFSHDEFLKMVKEAGSLEVTASNSDYRNGMVEGWISVDDAAALANQRGVMAVLLSLKPINDVGAATSQAVVQHRVDQIPQFDGTGITIGVMSDSYDRSASTTTHELQDIASGDLPGVGNPLGNVTPVTKLDDSIVGTDEGRGMMQVVHDMVPKARLGFATANTGEAGFSNNIRALAAISGATGIVSGFKADIVVDDVIYFAEPFFSDGIIAQGVNTVTNAGVHYFSSAGNRESARCFFDTFRPAPSSNPTAGSNISLAGVDPNLYAGGFHNFRSDGGLKISQRITRTSTTATTLTFQWDDPYDSGVFNNFFSQARNFTAGTTSQDTIIPLTAGSPVRITATATAPLGFDAIVTVLDPSGAVVVPTTDTGTDEAVSLTPAVSGNFTVRITAFGGTTGPYTIAASTLVSTGMTSDYNLLFFNATGGFIGSTTSDAFFVNRPNKVANIVFSGSNTTQLVIAKTKQLNLPAVANRIRYVAFSGNSAPQEFFSYQTPVTFGHNSARDGHGVAAYAFFPPYVPEAFTSPGPVTIVFDAAGNRLAQPEMRQKPDIAAMDGSRNTFFGGHATQDPVNFPNFFGTSCAAPNAASVAALVLQAKGGPGSLNVRQMKQILQSTTFQHDLDPQFAQAQVRVPGGKLTVAINGDGNNLNDPASDLKIVSVNYVGAGSVASIKFDMSTGNPTGGNVNTNIPGLAWDTRATASGGFPFTLGTLVGLATSDITPVFTIQPPAPSVAGQFSVLTLNFAAGAFTGGKSLTFACDRDEQTTASLTAPSTAAGQSASLWGAAVRIPQGTVATGGVTMTVTMADASVTTTTFQNRIGRGYSPLDGFGFLNAQAAVAAPVPAP